MGSTDDEIGGDEVSKPNLDQKNPTTVKQLHLILFQTMHGEKQQK